MADKGKRMIFEDEYRYLKDLKNSHNDPTAPWGGGGGVSIVDVSTYVMQGTALPDDIYNEIINNNPYIKTESGLSFYYHLVEERDQYLIFEYTDEIGSNTHGTDPDISEVEFMSANRLKLDRTTKIMSHDSSYIPLLTINDTSSSANVKILKSITLGGGSTNRYEIPTPTVVSANTGSTPTATLTDLQVGSITYEIPQGGGSTPTNMVTTDTYQTITANKRFKAENESDVNAAIHIWPASRQINLETSYDSTYISPESTYIRDAAGTRTTFTKSEITFEPKQGSTYTSYSIDVTHYSEPQGGSYYEYVDSYKFVPSSENSSHTYTVATTDDIPTNVSELNNDSGYITGINSSDVTTALGFTPYSSSNPDGYITGIDSSMVTTALGYTPGTSNFSGDYTDLTNKPNIPTNTSDLNNNSGFITNTVNDLTNYTLSSSLSTVATSGSYNDLLNKPTIPTRTVVYDCNDAVGVQTTQTWSNDVFALYDYIHINYRSSDGALGSFVVPTYSRPSGNIPVTLSMKQISNTGVDYLKSCTWYLASDGLSLNHSARYNQIITNTSGTITLAHEDYIYLLSVVGYKY